MQRHPVRRLIFLIALVVVLGAATSARASTATSLLSDLKPGEWLELPNTQMRSVYPDKEKTTWGVVGPGAVIAAWGGAAFDTKRNAFVFNGGGHTDYGGNEVYAFFLDELKWRRLTDPSPMKQLESGQFVTLDDTPVSAHTYDGLEYLPSVDRIFRNGGVEWRQGSFDHSAWLFDMDTRRWERRSAGGGGEVTTAVDPERGTVYVLNNHSVQEYDPRTDTWLQHLSGLGRFPQLVAAFDPVHRQIVTNAPRSGVIVYKVKPDGSIGGRTAVATKGATEWDKMMAALEYDPVRKALVAWAGGRETAYLDPATMTWTRLNNQSSPAAPVKSRDRDFAASGGIYGRWRYVPKYDVFIGYNAPRANVWVWKPAHPSSGTQTPAPPPVFKTLLQGVKDGQTVVIPPGSYKEAVAVRANNVTIKADGVKIEDTAVEGKAALVIKGNNVTVEGLECSGIRVPDGNGACVRLEGRDLTLRRVYFHDSQSGVLTWNRDSGTILVEDSRFERIGREHCLYVGRGDTHLVVRNSTFLSSAHEGHGIKSRAARNTIEGNVIASLDGVDSRLIDLPEGGENVIRRNVLAKGPTSSNQDLIGVGLESHRGLHPNSSTTIEDNIVLMERKANNVFVHHRSVPEPRIERNLLVGGKPLGGSNSWHANRAAAGIAPYPALPRPKDLEALR